MGIKDFFKGSAEGIIGGLTNGTANIISKIKADPTKVIEYEKELEELRVNSTLKATELANQLEEAYLKDTQSARDAYTRIEESENASKLEKNIRAIMILVITIGFFGLLGYMLKFEIPKSNERIMDIMLGSLGTAWITTIGFYFGSSQGSKETGKRLHDIYKSK